MDLADVARTWPECPRCGVLVPGDMAEHLAEHREVQAAALLGLERVGICAVHGRQPVEHWPAVCPVVIRRAIAGQAFVGVCGQPLTFVDDDD